MKREKATISAAKYSQENRPHTGLRDPHHAEVRQFGKSQVLCKGKKIRSANNTRRVWFYGAAVHLYATFKLSLPHLSPHPLVRIEGSSYKWNFQECWATAAASACSHQEGWVPCERPLSLPTVLVSVRCFNKWPRTRGLKTTRVCYRTVLEVRNLRWVLPKWRFQQGQFLLEAPRDTPFPCLL